MAYRESAKFYDLFALGKEDEQAFYRLIAQEAGSPALELGVGTGLFAFLLAQDGIKVVGLESSPEMLQEARNKLQKAPKEIARRLLFMVGNMSHFELNQRFRLIYVPSGTFQYLSTREEQVGCLQSVHAHLHAQGNFVFDIWVGPVDSTGAWRRMETVSLPKGGAVTRSISTLFREEKGIIDTIIRFDVHNEKGSITETYYDWSHLAVLSVEDVQKLLTDNGFEIESIYSSFSRESWRKGADRAIFITEVAD